MSWFILGVCAGICLMLVIEMILNWRQDRAEEAGR